MRLLIVEDEEEILNFLKKSLIAENFAVDTADNGEDGSHLARTNNYDMIILDNIMPRKIGREVCEEVRQAGITTPIIMLSVKSDATTKVDLLNAGADDYLTKPFSLEELKARIKALLRRPQTMESDILEIDDLVLDNNRHIVKRDGKEIYLTRKEFMLLKYLMRNAGNVLSKGMLLEHVWDMSVDAFSNTVESHIVTLRRKIDIKGKKPLIQTLPGIGYRLENVNKI